MTKGIIVAGLAGGSGKSVVSVGLTAALARQGKVVVPFKKARLYRCWLDETCCRKKLLQFGSLSDERRKLIKSLTVEPQCWC